MALAQSEKGSSVFSDTNQKALLPIASVTPFTMLDYPGCTACIIWFSGCNMRCAYCHNPELVKGKGQLSPEHVMAFLNKRAGLLDGVVLSGGEACVYPGLPDFIKDIKALGYAVKLDTNGLRPDIIERFLNQGLLDYVALDYKAPPGKYKLVTGTDKYKFFSRTLDLLCAQKAVPVEVRTTVHTGLLNEQDVCEIMKDLNQRNFTGHYYVQNFRSDNDRPTLGGLKPQTRVLDTGAFSSPKGFETAFRNF